MLYWGKTNKAMIDVRRFEVRFRMAREERSLQVLRAVQLKNLRRKILLKTKPDFRFPEDDKNGFNVLINLKRHRRFTEQYPVDSRRCSVKR